MHVEIAALTALTSEKEISFEQLVIAIEIGVLTAYNEIPEAKRQARAFLDRETGEIQILVPTFNELGWAFMIVHIDGRHPGGSDPTTRENIQSR
jgi:N utilization substance protein A